MSSTVMYGEVASAVAPAVSATIAPSASQALHPWGAIIATYHAGASAGAHERAAPESSCAVLLRTATYGYDWRDTTINLIVLGICVGAFCAASAVGELTFSALFWVPLAGLVSALQCIVTVLAEQQGFSLVWAVLGGLMAYEEACHHVFSRAGVGVAAVALAAAAAGGLAVVYYAIEELLWFNVPKGGERCPALCWYRTGTTMLHLAMFGLGALVGLAADSHAERTLPFWVVVGLAGAAGLALFCVLRRLRWLRRCCGLARVAPSDEPASSYSDQELAIALLQAQLLQCRDQLGRATAAAAAAAGGAAAAAEKEGAAAKRVNVEAQDVSRPALDPADAADAARAAHTARAAAPATAKVAAAAAVAVAATAAAAAAAAEANEAAAAEMKAQEKIEELRKRELLLLEHIAEHVGQLGDVPACTAMCSSSPSSSTGTSHQQPATRGGYAAAPAKPTAQVRFINVVP